MVGRTYKAKRIKKTNILLSYINDEIRQASRSLVWGRQCRGSSQGDYDNDNENDIDSDGDYTNYDYYNDNDNVNGENYFDRYIDIDDENVLLLVIIWQ